MSSPRPDLRLDWCSYEAAKYAVEHWHYSRKMPAGKTARVGVWEDGCFIGAVLFGSGTAPQACRPYRLTPFEIGELVRVALTSHCAPVSRIVAIAIRFLRQQSPKLRLITSYADPAQGHHGGIYQAGGWVYVGTSEPKWRANGQHNRAFGTSVKRARVVLGPNVRFEWDEPKHKYLMPLDAEMRERIMPLAKPYPRRPRLESEAPPDQGGTEGAAMRPAGSIGEAA